MIFNFILINEIEYIPNLQLSSYLLVLSAEIEV